MNTANPYGSSRNQPGAFTLIELLIVIAIVGLLASLLLPALSGTKRVTQSAACKTRLRQVGYGLSLYTADFAVYPNVLDKLDRYLQDRSSSAKEGPDNGGLNRPAVLQCPTQLAYRLNLYGSISWTSNKTNSPTNESLGLALTCPSDPLYGPFLPDTEVAVPAEMFATGDAAVSERTGPDRDACFARGLHFRPEYVHRPSRDYPDVTMANMLFCDGHVEEGRKTVWEARTEIARRRWNRDHLPHNEQFTN